jgi:pilus assembly protein CpaD
MKALRLLPLGLLIGLGACSSFEERRLAAQNIDKRIPITLAQDTAVLDVRMAGGGLAQEDANRVLAFLQQYRAAGYGAVAVQTEGGRADRAVAQVADLAVVAGLSRGIVRAASGAAPNGGVRLSYVRAVAHVEPCQENWNKNLASNYENTPYPALGCATQTNMAAQVSDPRDFESPRAMDPSSAARRATVHGKYVEGEATAARTPEGASGKVAEAESGAQKQ